MRYQKVPSRSGNFGQMVYLAKMANIHKSLSKTSNEMAKGQFKRDDFNEKGEFAKMAKIVLCHQSLANVPMTWQRLPFESGDFSENGKYCKHPPVLGKIQMRWQKGPLKVVIFMKMVNMVRIRQSLSYKSNKMAKGSRLTVAILPKLANLAKTMKMAKIHQSLRKN